MTPLLAKLAPSATQMIRADHTRVLALFHRYDISGSPAAKRAIVASVCLALEIHAQVEEEIFYPAMRAAAGSVVEKSVPEHDEMRRRIAMLRGMQASGEEYDLAFMELMRNVMHHVAEEETALLPQAERVLGERLGELGARMTRRRLELAAPHAGQSVLDGIRTKPVTSAAMAAGALVAGVALLRQLRRH